MHLRWGEAGQWREMVRREEKKTSLKRERQKGMGMTDWAKKPKQRKVCYSS